MMSYRQNAGNGEIRGLDELYHTRVHELRARYESLLPKYQAVRNRAEVVLRTRIEEHRIRCDVTSRIKDLASIRTKVGQDYNRMRMDYLAAAEGERGDYVQEIHDMLRDPILMVWDVIGLRCTGLFSRQLISRPGSEFEWVESKSSSDSKNSRREKAYDQYVLEGIIANNFNDAREPEVRRRRSPSPAPEEIVLQTYTGIHYIAALKPECVASALEHDLTEVRFEIQVRTAAEHVINDASRYLYYKNSESLLNSSEYDRDAKEVLDILKTAQSKLDNLFAKSRGDYHELLASLVQRGKSRVAGVKKLLGMKVSIATLRLYAAYEFVTLGQEKPKGLFELPKSVGDAVFDQFWLEELQRCLERTQKFGTIGDVREIVKVGIAGAAEYQLEVNKELGQKNSIFKPNDLTDVLSKCIIFGSRDLHGSYPIKGATLEAAKKYIESLEKRATKTE